MDGAVTHQSLMKVRVVARHMVERGMKVAEAHRKFRDEEGLFGYPLWPLAYLIYGATVPRGGMWRICGIYRYPDLRICEFGGRVRSKIGGISRSGLKNPHKYLWDNDLAVHPTRVYEHLSTRLEGRDRVVALVARHKYEIAYSDAWDDEMRFLLFGRSKAPICLREAFWPSDTASVGQHAGSKLETAVMK